MRINGSVTKLALPTLAFGFVLDKYELTASISIWKRDFVFEAFRDDAE